MVILFGEIRHREGGSEEGGETFVTIAWLSKEEYENIQTRTEGRKAGGERRRKGRRLEAMAEIRRERAE